MTDTTEYRYHPANKPIPEGWELSDALFGTHHAEYSVLLKKVEDA